MNTLLLAVQDTVSQVIDSANVAAPGVVAAPKELHFIDLLFAGGWVMIPLALLAFLGLVIFTERYLTIRKSSKDETNLMFQIRQNIHEGRLDSAIALCKNTKSPLARMLEKGLKRIGRPIKDIEGAIENTGKLEVSKLEKNIGILGIIAGIAPTLGFIGTISGVIKIFYSISVTENISIGNISGGLYEKMISSGSGLIVGIIAYSAYHLLNGKIDNFALKIQKQILEFVNIIQRA